MKSRILLTLIVSTMLVVATPIFAAGEVLCPNASQLKTGQYVSHDQGLYMFLLKNAGIVTVQPTKNSKSAAMILLANAGASFSKYAQNCPSPTCTPAVYICFYNPGHNGISNQGPMIMWSHIQTTLKLPK